MRNLSIEGGFFGTLFAAAGFVAVTTLTEGIVPIVVEATLRAML
ncbi:MAG: hypothetical protein R3F59_05470 [Myxococcota bacterium]